MSRLFKRKICFMSYKLVNLEIIHSIFQTLMYVSIKSKKKLYEFLTQRNRLDSNAETPDLKLEKLLLTVPLV